jgi:tetratricopeptide (TPR) repeat protein
VTIVAKGKVGEGWEKVFADVGSRACAYLGEALRLAGKHHEAEQAHDDAAELAKEGSDPELASTLHQLRAALARAQGDLTEALALLEQSAAALANAGSDVDEIWRVDLPYRRAEVLVDMGYVLSLREESEAARGVLEEALRVTESGHYPRLDLYARHNLALDKVRREQFDLAWQDLSKADPLYKPYGDDLIRAQRCWLRGTIQLSRNDPDEAVESFRRALDQYLDLGFGFDAVRIMLDLGRACVVGGQWQELANVLGWFQALGDRPILRRIILAELRRLRRLAAEQGLPTDPIEKAIEELEALQMPNRAN